MLKKKDLIRIAENICLTTPICKDNMGIQRSQMPQIKSEDLPSFLDELKEKGIRVDKNVTVPANRLHSTQAEINSEKVDVFPESMIGRKPMVVSKDGYLLDGHHQWAKAMVVDPKMRVRVHRVNIGIDQLLDMARKFEKTGYKGFAARKKS